MLHIPLCIRPESFLIIFSGVFEIIFNALKFMKLCAKSIALRAFCLNMLFRYFFHSYNMVCNLGVYPNSKASNIYFLIFQYLA